MESFLQNRPLATAGSFTKQSESSGDFQPFLRPSSLQDKPSVLTSGIDNPQNGPEGDEPKIELVNHKGRVERIVITCSCCKQIELECEY